MQRVLQQFTVVFTNYCDHDYAKIEEHLYSIAQQVQRELATVWKPELKFSCLILSQILVMTNFDYPKATEFFTPLAKAIIEQLETSWVC